MPPETLWKEGLGEPLGLSEGLGCRGHGTCDIEAAWPQGPQLPLQQA